MYPSPFTSKTILPVESQKPQSETKVSTSSTRLSSLASLPPPKLDQLHSSTWGKGTYHRSHIFPALVRDHRRQSKARSDFVRAHTSRTPPLFSPSFFQTHSPSYKHIPDSNCPRSESQKTCNLCIFPYTSSTAWSRATSEAKRDEWEGGGEPTELQKVSYLPTKTEIQIEKRLTRIVLSSAACSPLSFDLKRLRLGSGERGDGGTKERRKVSSSSSLSISKQRADVLDPELQND